ncbi:hypothetical protein [Cytobacillus oceanisediminis]|uniref:hypothetical protein n=1 Tax=Cytobacillus oceanisediminis TaxID=665099 RepID=UPI001FB403E7|nr:hypothetical protein [Cytobacillus oceanisediminis]UOE58002.1 hypothetical protein IRB79_27435 [Cytobacillus oceanisediminis]
MFIAIEKIMKENAALGVNETNPVPPTYHDREMTTVYFDQLTRSDRIVLERLRLVTDRYVPYYELSYCHAMVNGEPAEILNFPSPIPKRGWGRYLVDKCKKQGIFIKDLCDRSKISILS